MAEITMKPSGVNHERIATIRKRWSQYKVPPAARSDLNALLNALMDRDLKIAELERRLSDQSAM